MTFAEHVSSLATQHNVFVIVETSLPPDGGAAFGPLRTIIIAPVIDETTYMVAMHELGHLIAPGGLGGTASNNLALSMCALMDQEDAAWTWARAHAMIWTDLMEHWAQWARETYRQTLESAVKQTYVRPAPAKKLSEWK